MIDYLITGANGFIGSYLREFYKAKGASVASWVGRNYLQTSEFDTSKYFVDILDTEDIKTSLQRLQPKIIVHLAAQSQPQYSWQNPQKTFEVNTIGTMNIALISSQLTLPPQKFVFFGSSAEYGKSKNGLSISEDFEINPPSPYGISKSAASRYLKLHFSSSPTQLKIIRPFYVIGPGKTGDFCTQIAKQISEVTAGRKNDLVVGNINLVRDFLDIKDALTGIDLVIHSSNQDVEYNLASGLGVKLSKIIEIYSHLLGINCKTRIDSSLMRTGEEEYRVGDSNKLKELGWKINTTLNDSLNKILQAVRSN